MKITAKQVFSFGPIIPVVVINQINQAIPIAKSLKAGGLKVLEVTLRTPVAVDAIRLIAKEVPEVIVGAGTVINVNQLRDVIDAGAKFIISPGTTDNLLEEVKTTEVPIIPGISTASELMMGLEYGLSEFKFFPAEASGGLQALRAISGPFKDLSFCPTGGISLRNYSDYLRLDNVKCVGGSWLTPNDTVQSRDWKHITHLAHSALEGLK